MSGASRCPIHSVGPARCAGHHQFPPSCGGDCGAGAVVECEACRGASSGSRPAPNPRLAGACCSPDPPRARRRGSGRMSLRGWTHTAARISLSGALLTICSSTRDCPSASASSSRQRVTSRPTATSTVSPGRRATVHSSQRQLPSLWCQRHSNTTGAPSSRIHDSAARTATWSSTGHQRAGTAGRAAPPRRARNPAPGPDSPAPGTRPASAGRRTPAPAGAHPAVAGLSCESGASA